MAGFLGWVRFDAEPARFTDAMASLCHFPLYRGEVLAGDETQGVGVVYRTNDPPEVARIPERDLVVAVLGSVLEHGGGRWHHFTAAELANRFLDKGIGSVGGLDGSYQVLIWDGHGRQIHILNDRVGSMWTQIARTPGGVAFAPEAKALFRLVPLPPALGFSGVVSFLQMGHLIGASTLFEGVQLLPPGHRLTLGWGEACARVERVWAQRFEPKPRLGVRDASELLYEAVIKAHEAPIADAGRVAWLAQTGGYDSRVVLGALARLGRLPTLAVTWGATDGVPGSDVSVARSLAAHVGVPHRFLGYGAEAVPAHASEWVYRSELATDNLGFFAAGANFLFQSGSPPDAVYIGDHVVGLGGLPVNVDEAVETVLFVSGRRLAPAVESLLATQVRQPAGSALQSAVEALVRSCTSDRPKDIQDHLFLQQEFFRWNVSPAFYREPMVGSIRPLLLGPVMDVNSCLPDGLRVDKRVLVAVLRRFFPDLAAIPVAHADSLIDWQYESRAHPAFRTFLQEHTSLERLGSTPLGRWLDAEKVDALLTRFFSDSPQPIDRAAGMESRLANLRRRWIGVAPTRAMLRRVQPWFRRRFGRRARGAISPVRLVCRLAFLSILQSQIAAGRFDAGGTSMNPPTSDGR